MDLIFFFDWTGQIFIKIKREVAGIQMLIFPFSSSVFSRFFASEHMFISNNIKWIYREPQTLDIQRRGSFLI